MVTLTPQFVEFAARILAAILSDIAAQKDASEITARVRSKLSKSPMMRTNGKWGMGDDVQSHRLQPPGMQESRVRSIAAR